eukprot:5906462-Pyramimonas_sp.AAC.1
MEGDPDGVRGLVLASSPSTGSRNRYSKKPPLPRARQEHCRIDRLDLVTKPSCHGEFNSPVNSPRPSNVRVEP